MTLVKYKGDLACCGDLTYFETSYLMVKRIFDSHIASRSLKGLSHEIDFKNFDKNFQNLA